MKINLLGVRKEYKDDINVAINVFVMEFPVLNDMKIIIRIGLLARYLKRRFASHKNCCKKHRIKHRIKLNPMAFSCSGIERKIKTVDTANYESIKDIIWHELGHGLQVYILYDYYQIDLNNDSKNNYNKIKNEQSNNECYKEHMEYWLRKFDWSYDKAKKLLLSYGIDKPSEFIPECFNNYFRLKNKEILSRYEQETYNFVEAVIEDYKKYIPRHVN